MRTAGRKVLSVLMSAVLVLGLMPLPAYAENPSGGGSFVADNGVASASLFSQDAPDEETSQGSSELTAQEDGDIASGESGTCTWTIDAEGSLSIRPVDGEGVLGTWDDAPPWYAYREAIIGASIEYGVEVQTCKNMFAGCSSMTSYNGNLSFSSGDVDMSGMFSGCSSLVSLTLPRVSGSTYPVTLNLSSMFSGCSSLAVLDISSFDNPIVNNTDKMFDGCSNLAWLKLGNGFKFVPSEASPTCGLEDTGWDEDIAIWAGQGGENYAYTFTSEELVKNYDGSGMQGAWMRGGSESNYVILYQDGELVFQKDSTPEDGRVVTQKFRWYDTELDSLKELVEPSWLRGGSGVMIERVRIAEDIAPSSLYSWFKGLDVTSIEGLEHLDTSKATSMKSMFEWCRSLTSLDLSTFDTSRVTNMSGMFQNCLNLESLNLSTFNTSNVTDMSWMFDHCESLESLNLSNFSTSSVTDMSWMFGYCTALAKLDVSNFDASSVTNMFSMFYLCEGLESLDLSSFDASVVENMIHMFWGCHSLKFLNIGDLRTQDAPAMTEMFLACWSLETLDLSGFSKVDRLDWTFAGCSSLKSLDLSSFDTSQMKSMSLTFINCQSLEYLDISSFDTSGVDSVGAPFINCNALKKVKLGAKFEFKGSQLNDPPSSYPYTGKWVLVNNEGAEIGATAYTAAELAKSYDGSTMAGTYAWQQYDPDTVGPIYLLHNPEAGDYFDDSASSVGGADAFFYTASTTERDEKVAAGWENKGVAWYAPITSNTPVYRLYNQQSGVRRYTTDNAERNNLVTGGWFYEGIGWYCLDYDADATPVYRLHNPWAGNHYYTTSDAIRSQLISLGWLYDGVAWYAVAEGDVALVLDIAKVGVQDAEVAYTGDTATVLQLQTSSGNALAAGTDFTIVYRDSNGTEVDPVEIGEYTMEITGIGGYSGTTTAKLTILKNTNLRLATVQINEVMQLTDNPLDPVVSVIAATGEELSVGDDYTVKYYGMDNYGDLTVELSSMPTQPGRYLVRMKGTGTENEGYYGYCGAYYQIAGSGKVRRLHDPSNGRHLFTCNVDEAARLVAAGWADQGVAWVSPANTDVPVYRLYNPWTGEAHYTTSELEYNGMISYGWAGEGIAWYSSDSEDVAVYRMYNPNAFIGNHLYTTSLTECDDLGALGWMDEGIAWYASEAGDAYSGTPDWPLKRTVTFDSAGGSAIDPATVEEGKAVAAPAAPTRAGYDFAGWKLGGADYNFNAPVMDNITLVASWNLHEYSITYDLAGGTVEGNPTAYTVESPDITLANPTREPDKNGFSYTFAGWKGTGVEGVSKEAVIPSGSTGDRAYTAVWTTVKKGLKDAEITVANVEDLVYGSDTVPEFTVEFAQGGVVAQTGNYFVTYYDVAQPADDTTPITLVGASPGTYYAQVSGKGDYTGSQIVSFEIKQADLTDAVIAGIPVQTYTGESIEPEATVMLNGAEVPKDGYTLTYEKNTDAGTATVKAEGAGNYKGTVSSTFEIAPATLSADMISIAADGLAFTGAPLQPAVSVTFNNKAIDADGNYAVSYAGNVNAGTAKAIVAGTGNFTGTAEAEFTIGKASLSDKDVSVSVPDQVYTGEALYPPVTVTFGTYALTSADYTVEYSANTEVGQAATATLKAVDGGNFDGEVAVHFAIAAPPVTAVNLGNAVLTVSGTAVYDGTAKTPAVLLDGEPVDTDALDVAYANNVNAGTATVVVTPKEGSEAYAGSAQTTFAIAPASLADARISVAGGSFTYTGEAQTPPVSVTLNGKALAEGTDYAIEYSGNVNAGQASVKASGIANGNYSGTASGTFTIAPVDAKMIDVAFRADSGKYYYKGVGEYYYMGLPVNPAVTAKLGETPLVMGTDYTLSYSPEGTTAVGSYKATITFKGNYGGAKELAFSVLPSAISFVERVNALPAAESVVSGSEAVATALAAVTVLYSQLDAAQRLLVPASTLKKLAAVTEKFYQVEGDPDADAVATTVGEGESGASASGDAIADINQELEAGQEVALVVEDKSEDNDKKERYKDRAGKHDKLFVKDVKLEVVDDNKQTVNNLSADVANRLTEDLGHMKLRFSIGTEYKGKTAKIAHVHTGSDGFEREFVYGSIVDNDGFVSVYVDRLSDFIITVQDSAVNIGATDAETVISGIPETYVYDGTEKKPEPVVTVGGTLLVNGDDYNLSYENNMNAGDSAKVTVTGSSDAYTGTASATFSIAKADIADTDRFKVTIPAATLDAASTPVTPAVTVRDTATGKDLASGDFSVAYSDNTAAGTGHATLTANASSANYTVSEPRVESFTVNAYVAPTDPGTNPVPEPAATDISKAKVVADPDVYAYTGEAVVPTVTVMLDGALLTADAYKLFYRDAQGKDVASPTDAGIYTIVVTGQGTYTGTAQARFEILAPGTHVVTFNSNGGSAIAGSPATVADGGLVEKPADPVRADYTFAGWYHGAKLYDFSEPVTEDLTLVAAWSVNQVTTYRLYNPWSGDHHFTVDADEIGVLTDLGWDNEGEAWVSPAVSDVPVYRLYNQWSHDHHYTTDKDEYDQCVHDGWTGEGVKFYSADKSGVAVLRGFNPYVTEGTHHYTANASEMGIMLDNGWEDEGIGWYALSAKV